jgi:hypothetical protein
MRELGYGRELGHGLLLLALFFSVGTVDCWAQSQSKTQTQTKSANPSTQQTPIQPNPIASPLTSDQIEKAIADGVNAAAQKYEMRHPPMAPDSSIWWFNLFLAAFTGGLVLVGAGQCFLLSKQARLLTAIESPMPIIVGIRLVQFAQIPGETVINQNVAAASIPENCRIIIGVENKGRSPLRFTELYLEKFSGLTLPEVPEYENVQPWSLVLEKGPVWLRPDDAQSVITAADLAAAGTAYGAGGAFWVYGYFAYRTLPNERGEHKFLARWIPNEGFSADTRTGYT